MSITEKAWETIAKGRPEQVAAYREQGYVKIGRIFTHAEIDTLRAHVDEMIAALPEGKRPEGMDVPHFGDPWLFRYLADPRVLDVMEAFIGPDIVLWSSHFIAKPAGDGRAVPWHTDGAYWGSRLQPMEVITLWLAVDESRVENGCMRVIRGSHRDVAAAMERYEQVDSNAHVFGFRLPPELTPEERAVDLELEMGEAHLHDAWTIHGSNANVSPLRRCGYTMRYMPAHVYHEPKGSHRIYLLRGQDRTGGRNVYAPVPDLLP
ncbi:MAG TPA: phytanoyl-CoA dioxygenase family protein [Armatimonadota bacterium]|nr:phytanoyl-CoA dioxygenase family protein [Armatimonadota bacterium]